MINISVVLYNTDHNEIISLLNTLEHKLISKIYVIDNSPTDTVREIIPFNNKIIYIWGHGNIGYGGAHNIAIDYSVKDCIKYHLIINSDIQISSSIFDTIVEFMDTNQNNALLMPKILGLDNELQYLCKLLPTPIDLIGRRFFSGLFNNRNKRFEMYSSGYNNTINVPFLSGCFMFCRTDALERVNGFDDRYFMYCEDIDLCRRLNMEGYRTIFYPEVSVVHAHRKESFKNKKMLKIHIQSAIRYFNKWGWFIDKYRSSINKKTESQYI